VRADFVHKLTTRLCRENQTLVIEDLNVRGMLANARLARSISDIGFHEFRRQLQYKATRYDTHLMLADRWSIRRVGAVRKHLDLRRVRRVS